MATKTKLTLEEFLALPETEPASEFVCGEVVQKPMPSGKHAIVGGRLSRYVGGFIDDNRLGESGPEWRCVFGPRERPRAYVPDFVFIAERRLSGDASIEREFRGAPDLAVEILSPDDWLPRAMEKIWFYLRNGVRLVWLIDPRKRTITIFEPSSNEGVTLAGDNVLEGGDVLPGLRLTVDTLFPRPRGQEGQSSDE